MKSITNRVYFKKIESENPLEENPYSCASTLISLIISQLWFVYNPLIVDKSEWFLAK